MRLIDADALKESLKTNTFRGNRFGEVFDTYINNAPTIEERKTGKWKRTYLDHEAMGERPSIFYCSACNQCIAYPVNYCPSCGSDMRGDDHETD